MKLYCSFLLVLLCWIRIETFEHSIDEGIILTSQVTPENISLESLDALVEKGLAATGFTVDAEAASITDALRLWWYGRYGGTAFFFTPQGHLITNKHVVESFSGPIVFLTALGEAIKVSVVAKHATEDVAILKIDEPKGSPFPYFKLSSVHEVGDWVFSFRGKPTLGDSRILLPSIGKILGPTNSDDFFLFFLSISGVPGNSGSPVLNFKGEAIGVLTYQTDLGILIATPFHRVKGWIKDVLHRDGCEFEDNM